MRQTFGSAVIVLTVLAAGALSSDALAQKTPLERPLAQAGFELIAKERGVRAYKHRRAKDIRIAGEADLPVAAGRLMEMLLDYNRHAGAVPRLAVSRVLERDASSLLVYQRLRLPLIDDRDFTLRVHWGHDGEVLWLTYEAEANAGPPSPDGVVRMPRHSGSWQLRPSADGRSTFARYETRLSLGGWVPMWMARSRAGKDIPALFGAVCRMLGVASCS